MKLLETMYRSDFGSLHDTTKWGKRYSKKLSQVVEIETKMMEQCPDIKEMFAQYHELQGELNGISMYHEFEQGFRMGAQLMAEMMEDITE